MKKLLFSRALKGLQSLGQVWAPQGGKLKVRGQARLFQVVSLPGLAPKPRNVAELQGWGQC